MPLIVDCYNLLYVSMPQALAGLDEGLLCQLLASSRWQGEAMTVVCDGVVKPHTPERSPVGSVKLAYSGKQFSADEIIIDMVQRSSAPKRLTIVTTDREIQQAVRRRRAKVINSEDFIGFLLQALEALRHNRPPSSPMQPPLSTDQWLKAFDIDPKTPLAEGRKTNWWDIEPKDQDA